MPFAIPINYGAVPGRMIQILGQVPLNGQRITVNLQSGPGETPENINLHFDARINDKIVVRNSRRKNKWLNEEKSKTSFPFQRGQAFDMLILMDEHKFNVIFSSIVICENRFGI